MRALGELRRRGILGMNRRNALYTLAWNDRRFYPRVDDKLLTKRLCRDAGIPTPALLAVAQRHYELRGFVETLGELESFVIKPARGAMGNGVMVIEAREGERVRSAGGRLLDADDLRYHAASIISGLFALGGHLDVAFAEERLILHPEMGEIAAGGVPDVRIVVYRGVPVMAMTRLPTLRSRGRANLHQGAVGAGVDLATGRIGHAVLGTEPVQEHPDTGQKLLDRALPSFDDALDIAIRATDLTELGYVGADVVVDANHGSLILELNARPGLAIQIANASGLRPRLEAVDTRWKAGMSVGERVSLGREIATGRG